MGVALTSEGSKTAKKPVTPAKKAYTPKAGNSLGGVTGGVAGVSTPRGRIGMSFGDAGTNNKWAVNMSKILTAPAAFLSGMPQNGSQKSPVSALNTKPSTHTVTAINKPGSNLGLPATAPNKPDAISGSGMYSKPSATSGVNAVSGAAYNPFKSKGATPSTVATPSKMTTPTKAVVTTPASKTTPGAIPPNAAPVNPVVAKPQELPVQGNGTGVTDMYTPQQYPEYGDNSQHQTYQGEYDPSTKTYTDPNAVNQGQPQGQSGNNNMGNDVQSTFVDTAESVLGGLTSLSNDARQWGVEGMAAVAVQFDQMLQMINAMEQNIVGQLQNQMGGIDKDPQLLAAIGLIRDEVNQQRNAMLEELNAKGLAQSGILLEMTDRLNKGQLTQVQQLVASRFGDLQNQLNQAVMNFAGMRINALGNSQNQAMNIYNTTGSNLMNVGLAKANAGMQVAGMQNQAQIATMNNNTDVWKTQYNGANAYNIAAMNNATQKYGYDIGSATDMWKTAANNTNNIDVANIGATSAANVANINGGYDVRQSQIAAGSAANVAKINNQGSTTGVSSPADAANQAVSEILRDYPTGKLGYDNVGQVISAIDNNPNIPPAYKQDMKNQIMRAVESRQIPWSLK